MTKTTRRLAAAYTVAALFMAIGCGTPGRIPPPIEDDVRLLNDWKMVVQISEPEGLKVRKLVGYLNKHFFIQNITSTSFPALTAWLPLIVLTPVMVVSLDRMKT